MIAEILSRLKKPPVFHDCEFNIEGLEVFGVERTADYRTLIGFKDSQGEHVEYYLPASPDKHAEILKRFRDKIKTAVEEERKR